MSVLQPGMALRADVILENRSFAEWLLEPLLALRARGAAAAEQQLGAGLLARSWFQTPKKG